MVRFKFIFALMFWSAVAVAVGSLVLGSMARPATAGLIPVDGGPALELPADAGAAPANARVAAPDAGAGAVAAPESPAPQDGPPRAVAGPMQIKPEAPPETAEVLEAGAAAYRATLDAARQPTVATIAAAIGAALWMLIAVARKWGGMLPSSNAVRIFIGVASAAAGGLGMVIEPDMPWWQIAQLVAGPMISVVGNELVAKPARRAYHIRKLAKEINKLAEDPRVRGG